MTLMKMHSWREKNIQRHKIWYLHEKNITDNVDVVKGKKISDEGRPRYDQDKSTSRE